MGPSLRRPPRAIRRCRCTPRLGSAAVHSGAPVTVGSGCAGTSSGEVGLHLRRGRIVDRSGQVHAVLVGPGSKTGRQGYGKVGTKAPQARVPSRVSEVAGLNGLSAATHDETIRRGLTFDNRRLGFPCNRSGGASGRASRLSLGRGGGRDAVGRRRSPESEGPGSALRLHGKPRPSISGSQARDLGAALATVQPRVIGSEQEERESFLCRASTETTSARSSGDWPRLPEPGRSARASPVRGR